jgi:hypothetical protein
MNNEAATLCPHKIVVMERTRNADGSIMEGKGD